MAKLIDEFNEISGDIINRKPTSLKEAKTSQESFYYWIRIKYNKLSQTEKMILLELHISFF